MPQLSKQEMESAIDYEAEQYVPIPISEVRLTWQVISSRVGPDKKTIMDVLLVAAPKTLFGVGKRPAVTNVGVSVEPVSCTTLIL